MKRSGMRNLRSTSSKQRSIAEAPRVRTAGHFRFLYTQGPLPITHCRIDVREHMAYSVLVAETAWPEVPETVKPSKKIREERLEILNKSHILRPSHFLKHSHILKPSHARQFIPRARRQFTYETPHLQGPVPSESPANHGKTRASQRFSNPLIFSNRLTPDSSYPVRVAKTPYLEGPVPSESPANHGKTRASQRFSITPIFSNRLTLARPSSPPTPQIILR